MEINISENIKMEKHTGSGNTFGRMEIFMMETGLMELEKEVESGKMSMGNPIPVNGKNH
jgi:hypothetical protein